MVALGLAERSDDPEPFPEALSADDAATMGVLRRAWDRREFRGRKRELTILHRPADGGRVALIGLGPRAAFSAETVRRAAAEVMRGLRGKGARSVGFVVASFLGEPVGPVAAVRALVDGSVLGGYEFVQYKSKPEPGVEEVSLHTAGIPGASEPELTSALEEQRTVAGTVVWTRERANLPADTATPARIAEEALALGREVGLKVTIFDEAKLSEMGCGGLLAVGGGSSHPPRMVVLEHAGKPPAHGEARTIVLVGKGITFDSGGISIKEAKSMSYMKFDKSGAMAVLGTMRAAALLGVAPRVVGILCCAENLPSGDAYRPGDLVRTFGGKTIEVLNTDAEGRVVMSDGLGYGVKTYRPDTIVDVATLTGAEVVALGDDTAGLVSTDDRLAAELLAASAVTGEPLWRMPLTDYHRELVRSEVGDVRNSIEIPLAGMLTAAAFLETFVDGARWAHLDIAGPAYTTITTRRYQPAYQGIGATAFGVRVLTRFLLDATAAR